MNLCTRSGNWGPARPAHWQTTVNNSAQKGHGASLGVLFLGRCARPAAQLSTTRIVGPVRSQRALPPLTFWDYPFTLFKNQVYINVHIIIFIVYINVIPFSPTDTYHPLSEESLPTECFPTSISFCKRSLMFTIPIYTTSIFYKGHMKSIRQHETRAHFMEKNFSGLRAPRPVRA